MLNNYCNKTLTPNRTPITIGIADSGCSDHYAATNADVKNIRPAQKKIKVMLPNGENIESSHTAQLNISNIPAPAQVCHLFPAMKDKMLISLGKLCDNDMEIKLTKTNIYIYDQEHKEQPIIIGNRNATNGMWYLDTSNKKEDENISNHHQANSVYELRKKKEIIDFLAQAMWNPVPDTWVRAINAGFFATWPGLTADLVKKYYRRTEETEKGHMKADRKNVRSTKKVLHEMTATEKTNKSVARENEYYAKIIDLTNKIYSDQTGRFPITSSKGNKYIMVVHDHDSNAILARALKTKSAVEMLEKNTRDP